jgi:hypothetical protein
MLRVRPSRALAAAAALAAAGLAAHALLRTGDPSAKGDGAGPAARAAALPLAFEPSRVEGAWVARVAGGRVAVDGTGATVALRGGGGEEATFRVALAGARAEARAVGASRLPGTVSHLVGPRAAWRTGLPTFARVEAAEAWPGIDAVWYGNDRSLEYDLVVAPGADPSAIRLAFPGARVARVDAAGGLVLEVAGREVIQRRPVAWQGEGAARRGVEVAYAVRGEEVALALGPYDRGEALVVDPILAVGTYYGGAGADLAYAVGTDASGAIYLAGETQSVDLPAATPANAGARDAFVTKLSPDGTTLAWSVYFGGARQDVVTAMAVSGTGDVVVGGRTDSNEVFGIDLGGRTDGFVLRLTPAGALAWGPVRFGGTPADPRDALDDEVLALAVDWTAGRIAVGGRTQSADFQPRNAGPAFAGAEDGFVARLALSNGQVVWSRLLGGAPAGALGTDGIDAVRGLAFLSNGDVVTAGETGSHDDPATTAIDEGFPTTGGAFQPTIPAAADPTVPHAFVARLRGASGAFGAAGDVFWGTYLASVDGTERALAVAVDPNLDEVHVTGSVAGLGQTQPAQFPVTLDAPYPSHRNGANPNRTDAFLASFDAGGTQLFGTFLGGEGDDAGRAVAVDGQGLVHLAGFTRSIDFPVTADAAQGLLALAPDGFLTRMDLLAPTAQMVRYSTYLGGDDNDEATAIVTDPSQASYLAGWTRSEFGITTSFGAFQAGIGTPAVPPPPDDAFVWKFADPPTLSDTAPTTGSTLGGSTLVVNGTNLHPAATVLFRDPANPGVTLAGATVDGSGAPFSLVVTTPAWPTAEARVAVNAFVRNPDGLQSGNRLFTFIAPPQFFAIIPNIGSTLGGEPKTISGLDLQPGAEVTVGGVACSGAGANVDAAGGSTVCNIGPHAPGLVDVVVTNPEPAGDPPAKRQAVGPGVFEYIPPPVVTGISPTFGPEAGGRVITITGTGFRPDPGFAIRVGNANCTTFAFVSPTTATCTTGPGAPGLVDVRVTNFDGQSSVLARAFEYLAPPRVTAVTPAFGRPGGGTPVTISGAAFRADPPTGMSVLFGGAPATNVVRVSLTTVTATAPAGSGTVNVTVRNFDGQQVVLPGAFTYAPQPTITAVAPLSGPGTLPTPVVVTGTGFRDGAVVTFGGRELSVQSISPTAIAVTVPPLPARPSAPVPVDVVVQNPAGTDPASDHAATRANGFTFDPPPDVAALTPSFSVTAGGRTIVATGLNFAPGATVTIGGLAATGVVRASATELSFVAPALPAGTYTVVVTNPDQQTGAVGGFVVHPPPQLTSIAPAAGPTAGGTEVLLVGGDFRPGATVTVGGQPATVSSVGPSTLQAVTPAGVEGFADVVVTNVPDLQTATLAGAFEYVPPPVLASLSPARGPATLGATVELSGEKFRAGAAATAGGVPATSVLVLSPALVRATFPAAAPGTVDVQVTNPDGQQSGVVPFTWDPPPAITAVANATRPQAGPSGALAGGETVVISGSAFVAGVEVRLGANLATVTQVTPTSVTAVTPPGAAGLVDVVVRNPDQQVATASFGFEYVPAPALLAVSPASGPTAGGTALTLTVGDPRPPIVVRFGAGAGAVEVQGTLVNAFEVSATTPAFAAGAADVTVVNGDGQVSTVADAFTFVPPPALAQVNPVTPATGPTAGGTRVTVAGQDFLPGATVELGGVAATDVTFVSATTLTALTPAQGFAVATPVAVTVRNPDGQAGTAAGAFTYLAPPVLSAVSPAVGPTAGGTVVTLTGANFDPTAAVRFGAATLSGAAVTRVDATTLRVAAPPAPKGLVDVAVVNADGQSSTIAGAFRYLAPPALASIAPAQGTTLGGTAVRLDGADLAEGATVAFGGVPATGIVVAADGLSLTAVTPASAVDGPVDVRVSNPDGQAATLAAAYRYVRPPAVTAMAPDWSSTLGGQAVVLDGSDFGPGAVVVLREGGAEVATLAGTVAPARITFATPARPAGPVTVAVRNPDGQESQPRTLTYYPPPALVSAAPPSGSTTVPVRVTLSGADLRPGATVTFGGVAGTEVVVSAGGASLSVLAPALPAEGPVAVVVTNPAPDFQAATLAGFAYLAPPIVTAMAPVSGPTAGGTEVALDGSGFRPGATVLVGGVAATVGALEPARLVFTTPARTRGPKPVVVRNPDGQEAPAGDFTFVPPPALASISPVGGPVAGGTAVTLSGADLAAGATVSFGGVPATGVQVLDGGTRITAVAPAAAGEGAVAVRVTNPDGQHSELAGGYAYAPEPAVAAVDPASGPLSGGTTVTVTGTGFRAGCAVDFGTVAATVQSVSPTAIVVRAPAGVAAGAVVVSVTNPDGQRGALAGAYTYVAPPAPASIAPARGPAAGGTAVVVTGTGFQPGAAVTLGGTAATAVVVESATRLTAVTPAHAAGTVDLVVTNPDGAAGTLAAAFTYDAPSSGGGGGGCGLGASGLEALLGLGALALLRARRRR